MDQRSKAISAVRQGNSGASLGSSLVALFLAVMLQWATLLVVCPSVHELIHHDAGDQQQIVL